MDVKQYEVVAERSEFGRSTLDIKCPFCSAITTAYKWSLAGSGKKCQCGAKHTLRRGTIAAMANETPQSKGDGPK